MEKNQSIFNILEKMPEIAVEQSIDTELVLPDYYPEISRVLKCLTDVSVFNKQLNAKKIDISGQVAFTLLYADKDDNLNSISHCVPFNKSVDCDYEFAENFVLAELRGEFLNTKATAPRKVEIHGSINFAVCVTAIKKINLPCECNEAYFAKPASMCFTEQFLPITKSVFLEDEISVGANKQPISKILRSSACVLINDCKIVSNKVVVKGEMKIQILYCPTESIRPVLLEHSHAFSQIVDCDAVSENCLCNAQGKVVSFELHPKTSLDGEVKSVTFEAKINLEIALEKDIECSCLCDAYSNRYPTKVEFAKLNLAKRLNEIEENFVCKKGLEFSEGSISEIYDVWSKNKLGFVSCDDGELTVKGTVTIFIIGSSVDGEPCFHERSVDYEYKYNLDIIDSEYICKPCVDIIAVNYSKNFENGIDIAVELNIKTKIYSSCDLTVVTDVLVDEANPLSFDNETAITLYFAEGETVWEIAKNYCADPEKICKANKIENVDSVCNKILLIPNM